MKFSYKPIKLMKNSISRTVNRNTADQEIVCLFGTRLSVIMLTKASEFFVYFEPNPCS